MDDCQCQGIEFETPNWVDESLNQYHTGDLPRTTAVLLEALAGYDIQRRILLDIGGGVGVVQLELLRAGAASATSVEASTAYLEVARSEATREGLIDRITHVHGNFVALAEEIAEADIVTLDRVICCFHDVHNLVSLSAAKARWLYGVTYPVDSLWNRISIAVENLWYWLQRNPFRAFVHPSKVVDEIVGGCGLSQVYRSTAFVWPNHWQIVLYERKPSA